MSDQNQKKGFKFFLSMELSLQQQAKVQGGNNDSNIISQVQIVVEDIIES